MEGTLQHHYDTFSDPESASKIDMLRDNAFVDNLMCTWNSIEELIMFKSKASEVLENGQFTIHKWESDVAWLESENMENPINVLGHVWDKQGYFVSAHK